ncbi:hypothetical protein L6452_15641 [Arctium lappa]|uniref:Uncharacterized protein n=1 Tax=Arctium lappa TaxID=4217 RepID=A0ACB9CPG1_ARCLA|nr:hypothetical protein L6452_15641 [Arctium lappa]
MGDGLKEGEGTLQEEFEKNTNIKDSLYKKCDNDVWKERGQGNYHSPKQSLPENGKFPCENTREEGNKPKEVLNGGGPTETSQAQVLGLEFIEDPSTRKTQGEKNMTGPTQKILVGLSHSDPIFDGSTIHVVWAIKERTTDEGSSHSIGSGLFGWRTVWRHLLWIGVVWSYGAADWGRLESEKFGAVLCRKQTFGARAYCRGCLGTAAEVLSCNPDQTSSLRPGSIKLPQSTDCAGQWAVPLSRCCSWAATISLSCCPEWFGVNWYL